LAPVVGIIGTMQSLEAIKLILNLSPLNSKLLIFDGMANEWKTIHFKQDKECKICANAKNSSS
jgi:molybdopterin/thiamine biosynthesis adenylyltransferase